MALIESLNKESLLKRPGYEVQSISLLLDILVFLSRQYSEAFSGSTKGLLQVGEVIATLESQFSRQWTLGELAELAYMSKSNLLMLFKEATGKSPVDYLIRIRIQKAMEMLSQSQESITSIALRVGFNDSNYFSRCFKKLTNLTPRRYREGSARLG